MRLLTYLQSLATEYSPRIHANGFIQLDLAPAVRLHIWGDGRIPRQRTPTPIHDHAFAFTSRVLVGRLTQREYDAVAVRDNFPLTEQLAVNDLVCQPHIALIRRGEDTVLVPNGSAVIVRPTVSFDVFATGDDRYSMDVGRIHETRVSEPSVSVIVKTGATLSRGGLSPTVMVPLGSTPSNEFDRHTALSIDEIWSIVDDVANVDIESVVVGIAWALRRDLFEEIS